MAVSFSYEGRRLTAEAGLTIAEALRQNGISIINRSMRLRAGRNEYHPLKEVPSAWVSVNGIPNVNAYRVRISEGMRIEPQTRRSLLSFLGKYAGTGFYYRNFTRSEMARKFFFSRVRAINDYGGPIDPVNSPGENIPGLEFQRSEQPQADVLVIGAGRTGLATLLTLNLPPGKKVVVVDALTREQVEASFLELRGELASPEYTPLAGHVDVPDSLSELLGRVNGTLIDGATVFGAFEGGLFTAVQNYTKVLLFRPLIAVLCTGTEEVKPLFSGSDLPGVVTSKSLLATPTGLFRSSRRPVLCIDSPLPQPYLSRIHSAVRPAEVFLAFRSSEEERAEIASALGIPAGSVREGTPSGAEGSPGVQRANIYGPGAGTTAVDTDLLVLAGRKQPRAELAMLLSVPTRREAETSINVPSANDAMQCAAGVYASGSLLFPTGRRGLVSSLIAGSSISSDLGGRADDGLRSLLMPLMVPEETPAQIARPAPSPDSLLCPCLDVTYGDMEKMASDGYETINRMRRFSGLFMGPCQGARCYRNTYESFCAITSREVDLPTVRPPIVPVYFGALAQTELEDAE